MKIRLLAPDSKIPNIAIMKISTFHKRLGDDVSWYCHITDYEDTDILYISKVFTFSLDAQYLPINAKIIRGGTGYDYTIKLPDEIENITSLDYSLYSDCDYSIIFTTRGCIRKCDFCIVPQKEKHIHNIPICELNPKGKWIMFMDNNFFANPQWHVNLETLKSYGQSIDFNQGIDLRILTERQCIALSSIKIKVIHCAWDNYADKNIILPKLELLCKYIKPYKITVYVLVGYENRGIVDSDVERVRILDELGIIPFAMGYIDCHNPKYKKSLSVKNFCRWVNMRATFKSCTWEEYKWQQKQRNT